MYTDNALLLTKYAAVLANGACDTAFSGVELLKFPKTFTVV